MNSFVSGHVLVALLIRHLSTSKLLCGPIVSRDVGVILLKRPQISD